jgi:outer membrane protein OmpA-like peptidoglycan-associated protein
MALFRPAHLFRALRPNERALAWEVFRDTLPSLDEVGVTDGLGDDGTIWTLDRSALTFLQSGPPASLNRLKYFLNFGEAVHWDLSGEKALQPAVPGYYDRARDVFVHEMTHVWQFHRGDSVKLRSIIAQKLGAGYEFTAGRPWEDYNVEQQAHIVETWNKERKGGGQQHQLFPYIHYIIRKENPWQMPWRVYWVTSLETLQNMLIHENIVGTDDRPDYRDKGVRVNDDSMVTISGDVLFDFDKAVVKPDADRVLYQAAATIKAKTTPRLRRIDINGYADSTGAAGYNEKLSERRAQAVASWFTSRNLLPTHLVRTQGFGEDNPKVPNSTPANRSQNRRVEIVLWNN